MIIGMLTVLGDDWQGGIIFGEPIMYRLPGQSEPCLN